MNNKILRLTELIQEGYGEDLLEFFKAEEPPPLREQLALINSVISFHQQRSADLWVAAGRKRSLRERQSAARAELAAFVFAWLTGEAKESVESAVEAMEVLGRHAEVDMVRSLSQ